MAGIYIHIPFCRRKCYYCNFYSIASVKYKDGFLKALDKEIELQKNYLNNEEVNTVYFGGGTPSLLSGNEINKIFEKLQIFHSIADKAEITLEVNPDDINKEKIIQIKQTPINRISIGVQSFYDEDLQYLNRLHDKHQASLAIQGLLDAGFSNLSVDLIYGIPTLSNEKWTDNINHLIKYNIPHLSAYSLTVEPKTILNSLIKKGKIKKPDENQSIEHFKILLEEMRKHNFINYEISNFAKSGYYSKHNSLYWLGGNYLGLGPSAHSYNGISRQWNITNTQKYIRQVLFKKLTYEKEVLTKTERFNEYIMTSLRTCWGCDLQHIKNVFGKAHAIHFQKQIKQLLEEDKVRYYGNKILLTDKGKLFADGIASQLFL